MNDNELELDPVVYIVIGRVWENEDASPDDAITIHALLTAPDDDDAVRKTLESLSAQGFAEAELDQIGVMDGEPDGQVLLREFPVHDFVPRAAGPDAEPFDFDLEGVFGDLEDLSAAVPERNGHSCRVPGVRVERLVERDVSLGADDLERVRAGSFEATVKGSKDAVVIQDRGDGGLDWVRGTCPSGVDADGGPSHDHVHDVDGIAPDVIDGAAFKARLQADLSRAAVHDKVEPRMHGDNLADPAGVDELTDFLVLRMEAVHEGLHEAHAVPLAGLDDAGVVFEASDQWLLAEDVLACLCCRHDPFSVEAVGERKVHGLDVRVAEEFFVRLVHGRDAKS